MTIDIGELSLRATDEVEAFCEPDRMTKQEAIDFLEAVIDMLTLKLGALREEIAQRQLGQRRQ